MQLGLFAGGLTSFIGGGEDDDDSANAGMEIIVHGSYFRRLEFFRGQGELMGHVWSGTASELTPAYQATTFIHDHDDTIQLNNGATIRVKALSSISVDLKGAIQLSLWHRNAKSQCILK